MNTPPHDRKRIYIAGPMTGIPWFNFPKFDAVRDEIERRGHIAVSPADLDRAAGFDAMTLPADTDWSAPVPGFDLREARRRDMAAIEQCDAIYMMPGWQDSVGAFAEWAYARWCQIPEAKL